MTFLSLLNPDSAVGVVSFSAAALQVCCLVQVWEVLAAQVWTFVSRSADLNKLMGGTVISGCFVNQLFVARKRVNVGVGDQVSPQLACLCLHVNKPKMSLMFHRCPTWDRLYPQICLRIPQIFLNLYFLWLEPLKSYFLKTSFRFPQK